jgi:thiol-disulfide isomerase/thioredoxin
MAPGASGLDLFDRRVRRNEEDPVSGVGVAVLAGTLALATVVGLVLRARSGRLRAGGAATGGWRLAGTEPKAGDRVLLLQLSSPVCTPCRRTAAVLTDLAGRRDGLVHLEVDVAERPDVARELGVMRTPTVVAFDRGGAELLRVSGVPRAAELEERLAPELAPA